MHKAAVALLAVPILVAVYIGALLRRSTLARIGLAFGLVFVLAAGLFGPGRPEAIAARPETPILPLTQAAFQTTVATGHDLKAPVAIEFSSPMDPVSVAASITVDPSTPVDLAWDATDTTLTIAPRNNWAAGTFHTVTVREGALARSGQPLLRPARAVFLTRDTTTGSVVASIRVGNRVSIASSFIVRFAGPVDPATVSDAVSIDPPVPGTLTPGTTDGATTYTFAPTTALAPNAHYTVTLDGVRDTDGVAVAPFSLAIRTDKAPAVVRFRPLDDTADVAREAAISVRFTQPMDRKATARAFAATIDGKVLAGKVKWAEADTVLVFTPAAKLPFGTKVVMGVAATARSASGATLGVNAMGTFHTVKQPKPATVRTTAGGGSSGGGSGGGGSGGGAVGGGSWGAVETYYLSLMNCTRTGGWVTSSGSCSSPGGRNVAALKLDAGISTNVSRPYAKKLATGNDCDHFIGGNPGDRLRRAGYTSYRWAENLGCRSGNPRSAVLGSHLFFQNEKSTSGGHYVNLMNAQYDRVGIGVWVYGGRVRLVVDFYHP